MCKDQRAHGPEPIRAKDHGLGTEPRGEAGEGGDARASGRVEEPGGVTGFLGATAAAAGAGLAGGRGLPARGCRWLWVAVSISYHNPEQGAWPAGGEREGDLVGDRSQV